MEISLTKEKEQASTGTQSTPTCFLLIETWNFDWVDKSLENTDLLTYLLWGQRNCCAFQLMMSVMKRLWFVWAPDLKLILTNSRRTESQYISETKGSWWWWWWWWW